MNRTLLALSIPAAGSLLIPDVAEAQRGGRGGARIGGAASAVGAYGEAAASAAGRHWRSEDVHHAGRCRRRECPSSKRTVVQ